MKLAKIVVTVLVFVGTGVTAAAANPVGQPGTCTARLPEGPGASVSMRLAPEVPLYLQFEEPVVEASAIGSAHVLEIRAKGNTVIVLWPKARRIEGTAVVAVEIVLATEYRLYASLKLVHDTGDAHKYRCFVRSRPPAHRIKRFSDTLKTALSKAAPNWLRSGPYCFTMISDATRLRSDFCSEDRKDCDVMQGLAKRLPGRIVSECSEGSPVVDTVQAQRSQISGP